MSMVAATFIAYLVKFILSVGIIVLAVLSGIKLRQFTDKKKLEKEQK